MNEDRNNIYFAEVRSVEDTKAGLRIKARIPYVDALIRKDSELPYAFPLIPKMLHVNPKVHECVLVILQTQGETKGDRFFVGPVISQAYQMNHDPYDYSARSLFLGREESKVLPDPKMNPENDGSLPDRDDVALQGRKNTDVILKDNEVRIRCGFKKEPNGKPKNTLLFNKSDMAYIQMRYNKAKDEKNERYSSVINIVADRINLLSHDSRTYFNLNDPKHLITDDEMKRILEEAHPLVYGDELIALMKKLIDLFQEHTHPFPQKPPTFIGTQLDTLNTDLTQLLSKSVKTN